MKTGFNLLMFLCVYSLLGSMESNYMSLKTGLICCLIIGVVTLLVNRKRPSRGRNRNGQTYNEPKYYEVHSHYTTRKGGMSR